MITKENVIEARNNQDIFLIKNFTDKMPSWKDISKLYDDMLNSQDLNYLSFAAMIIKNSHKNCDLYNNFIKMFEETNKVKLYFAMTIIHFTNRIEQVIDDSYALELIQKFYKNNNSSVTEDATRLDNGVKFSQKIAPIRHYDKEDRIFIQGQGHSFWRIFHGDKLFKEYTLENGDMIYIPKNLFHSVDTISPRFGVSLAFSDF